MLSVNQPTETEAAQLFCGHSLGLPNKSGGAAAETGAQGAAAEAPNTQGTVFTHPSPAAATQRTVASSLGEIVWLMSQSPAHKTFFISDLEWMVMTPVLLQQFRIFYDQQKPIGVALWGFVNDEAEARLSAGNAKLQPQDWKSGDKLWVVEIIAPFGGHEAMLQDLKSQVFAGRRLKFVRLENTSQIVSSL